MPAQSVNEYVRIDESMAVECLERLIIGIYMLFEATYMRKANNKDIQRLLQIEDACDFSSMLGSNDYVHSE